MGSLINTTFNGKKFSFGTYNIDSVMKCFDDQLIMNVYVCNRGSDIVFDTSIYNNKYV